MRKIKVFLLLSFMICTLSMTGQHCPFDFSAIIVLNIHPEDNTVIIPNLRITLLDSLDKPLMRSRWRNGGWMEDTLLFWINPTETTFKGPIDNTNPAVPEQIYFPFAKSNYVVVVGYNLAIEKYKIRIDNMNNKGRWRNYKSVTYPLKKTDLHSLCGTYGRKEWTGVSTEIILIKGK